MSGSQLIRWAPLSSSLTLHTRTPPALKLASMQTKKRYFISPLEMPTPIHRENPDCYWGDPSYNQYLHADIRSKICRMSIPTLTRLAAWIQRSNATSHAAV